MIFDDNENSIIRKQREEIILLTDELKNQELQLNAYDEANLKLKTSLKFNEEKSKNQEKRIKELENEVIVQKNKLEVKNQEIETNKHKCNQKEAFYSKQHLKLQQMQFTIENLNRDITQNLHTIKELKEENTKLNLKVSEQSNRYKDLKQKYDEILTILEPNKKLLDDAKIRIQKLEENLRNFVQLFNTKKKMTENILRDKLTSGVDTNLHENTLSSKNVYDKNEHDHIYYINLANSILLEIQDSSLNILLQSLKNHWFESNLICEEIKTIVESKYKNAMEQFHGIFDKIDDKTSERKLTSTPEHF